MSVSKKNNGLLQVEKDLESAERLIKLFDSVKDEKILLRLLEILHKSIELIDYKKADKKDAENFDRMKKIYSMHKESGFEFSKNGKFVILNEDLSTCELDRKLMVSFIDSLKNIYLHTKDNQ